MSYSRLLRGAQLRQMKGKKGYTWKKSTLPLAKNHSWVAPPGYKILVIDRGAVSFNIADDWILKQMEPLELHDAEPPNDEARIMVSHWHLPPDVDWTGLPLASLLEKSTADTRGNDLLERGEIIAYPRTDLEMVWTEHLFMDPVEHREAYTRIAMARGWNVHVLITCDFWVEDAKRIIPIWEETLRSLQLGRSIADPTKGVTMQ